ncbi:MAG: PD-(D/E)XK nuclease family protein [Phycisphaerae bacterium]
MGDSAEHLDLAGRIISSSAAAVLLRGPAATGKTRAVLECYRRLDGTDGKPAAMLLAPNVRASARYRRTLLESSETGVLVSPRVQTFAALADDVLAATQRGGRSLSALRRHLLLRRIVRLLASAGELAVLGPLADTPGLVPALEASIAELKRAAVEPDELARAVRGREGRTADLLKVYTRYQQELHDSDTYDLEGRMWLARDTLAAAREARDVGLDGVRLVAADGFTDFTPTQLEILSHLLRLTGRVVLTLPVADDGRERLWHWTNRTLEQIRRTFTDSLEEISLSPEPPTGGLRALWDRGFNTPADDPPPDGVSVISAPDTDAEVSAVAMRAKRLLAGGTPAGRIAVIARSLEHYRESVERIFAAYDVPVRPAPRPLTDVPIVRFLLAAAGLAAANFPSHDVLRMIRNSYFRPEALGDFDETTVCAAEAVIRYANILQGRESYSAAFERLAATAERDTPGEEPEDEEDVPAARLPYDATTLRSAGRMLEALFGLVAPAAADGQAVDTAALATLAEKLRLRDAACEADDDVIRARDMLALNSLESALEAMDPAPADMTELARALGTVSIPAPRSEEMVEVLDALDARPIRYNHVFVLGAAEGDFPRRFTESSLIQESDRLRWSQHGVRLDQRDEIARREMLLFYLAASRADQTLTFSYQAPDGSSEGLGVSPLLLSLLEPFGGLEALRNAGRFETVPPGRFVQPDDELCSRRDALNAAVAGLFGARENPSALAWAQSQARESLTSVARGLWAYERRWQNGPCNEYDGRVTDERLLRQLQRRFGPEAVFSASQLNTFGQCPWLFFATYLLGLEPPVEPQRRLEPVGRGLFVHSVLRRTFESLREGPGGSVRLTDIDERRIEEALAAAVEEESRRVERTRPPYPALWRLQQRQMHREMADYLARLREADNGEAVHFELGFGLDRGLDESDAASTSEPAELDTPDGPLKIRGKIDRVDRAGTEGKPVWMVIDYKTGSLPSARDIDEGRSMQLPLYSAAVETLFNVIGAGGEFHRIGRKAETRRFAESAKTTREDFVERRDKVLATAAGFAAAMREGRFDVLPTDKCPAWCPVKGICRFSRFRGELKQPEGGDHD